MKRWIMIAFLLGSVAACSAEAAETETCLFRSRTQSDLGFFGLRLRLPLIRADIGLGVNRLQEQEQQPLYGYPVYRGQQYVPQPQYVPQQYVPQQQYYQPQPAAYHYPYRDTVTPIYHYGHRRYYRYR